MCVFVDLTRYAVEKRKSIEVSAEMQGSRSRGKHPKINNLQHVLFSFSFDYTDYTRSAHMY